MREIISEDQLNGIRTITRIELTAQGVKKTMITEVIEPEAEDEDVIYDNFNEDLSTLAGGGIFVYDKTIRTSADGHPIYSFNDSVNMEFEMVFDCNDRGINNDYFYIVHNVTDVTVNSITFLEIDNYSPDSKVMIICNNEQVLTINISELTDPDSVGMYIMNLGGFATAFNSRTKWEIYISDNTNPYARGKLIWGCVSKPEHGIDINELMKEGANTDENEPAD